eukprot:COSAG01_NODE_1_length_100484_cov_170.446142_100_plen_180_part_00
MSKVVKVTEKNKACFDFCSDKFLTKDVVILSEYLGLSVSQLQSLKNEIRNAQGESKVLKNKIAQKALEQAEISAPESLFKNTSFFVFADMDNIGSVTKVLKNFQKKHEVLKVKGGLLEKAYVDASYIKRLAGLPSKEVLISKVLMLLKSPVQRLTATLSTPINKLNLTLSAIKQQKSEE